MKHAATSRKINIGRYPLSTYTPEEDGGGGGDDGGGGGGDDGEEEGKPARAPQRLARSVTFQKTDARGEAGQITLFGQFYPADLNGTRSQVRKWFKLTKSEVLLVKFWSKAEVKFWELSQDGEEKRQQRTVSLDQRVGEQNGFKMVEAFEVEKLDKALSKDGVSQLMLLDAQLLLTLPESSPEEYKPWMLGGAYYDAADLQAMARPTFQGTARDVRNALGFYLTKLGDEEVVEAADNEDLWFPLGQVVGSATVKKLKTGDKLPVNGSGGRDVVYSRRKVKTARLKAFKAL